MSTTIQTFLQTDCGDNKIRNNVSSNCLLCHNTLKDGFEVMFIFSPVDLVRDHAKFNQERAAFSRETRYYGGWNHNWPCVFFFSYGINSSNSKFPQRCKWVSCPCGRPSKCQLVCISFFNHSFQLPGVSRKDHRNDRGSLCSSRFSNIPYSW